MKKILLMPTKNEDWILPYTLAAAQGWADHIIIADQGSTDRTVAIAEQMPNVTVIRNTDPHFHGSRMRTLLLHEARQRFEGNNLLVSLDADEVCTSEVLTSAFWDSVTAALVPGQGATMPWVQLWGDANHYRDDNSTWAPTLTTFLFLDDRSVAYSEQVVHESRAPQLKLTPWQAPARVLHYAFADWSRAMAKQRYYRMLEKVSYPGKSSLRINMRYETTRQRARVRRTTVPEAWRDGLPPLPELFVRSSQPAIYWYEAEAVRWLVQYGSAFFRSLDIWDCDWEGKHRLLIERGLLPPDHVVIRDPRPLWLRWYHSAVAKGFILPEWPRKILRVLGRAF